MDAFESWKNEGKSIYPDLDLCDYCGAAFLAGCKHQRELGNQAIGILEEAIEWLDGPVTGSDKFAILNMLKDAVNKIRKGGEGE